jgi:hypothetical protein
MRDLLDRPIKKIYYLVDDAALAGWKEKTL